MSLAIEVQGEQASSYEGLGQVTCGEIGKLSVIISKGIYSFGCLVAYIVIIKDNFSLAVYHLLFGYNDDVNESQAFIQSTLSNQNLVTIFLCSSIMLPLCLLRDLKPLERFSALKISAVLLILIIVIYLFLFLSHQKEEESSFVDHWFVVRGGVFERYEVADASPPLRNP